MQREVACEVVPVDQLEDVYVLQDYLVAQLHLLHREELAALSQLVTLEAAPDLLVRFVAPKVGLIGRDRVVELKFVPNVL